MSYTTNHLDPLAKLSEYLDSCCKRHILVTYLEVVDAIEIEAPQRIHKLTQLLEDLMEQDQQAGLPQRAALVVSRSKQGLPAEGFFLKAQALGLMQGVSAHEFHQLCLEQLYQGQEPRD